MLVYFLEGTHPDLKGRFLADIWAFSDKKIEQTHDFIQWIFPLDEPSKAVWHAPVLIDEEIYDILDSAKAKENIIISQKWFLRFLINTDAWLVPRNHNHRRVSRMIKSIRLLHSDQAADQCISMLLELAIEKEFSSKGVVEFWKSC